MNRIDRLMMKADHTAEQITIAFVTEEGLLWHVSAHLWEGRSHSALRLLCGAYESLDEAEGATSAVIGQYPDGTSIVFVDEYDGQFPFVATAFDLPPLEPFQSSCREEPEDEMQGEQPEASREHISLIANTQTFEWRRAERRYSPCRDESS